MFEDMNQQIENIRETETGGYLALFDGIEYSVPNEPGNRHCSMIQTAIANGAVVIPYTPPVLTKAMQESARQFAYTQEADPLFFMAQRGEATIEEWQAKIAEIKARFPYPEAI